MSKIEVDAIDKLSGSTVTIGGSGTNVVLGTNGQSLLFVFVDSTQGWLST